MEVGVVRGRSRVLVRAVRRRVLHLPKEPGECAHRVDQASSSVEIRGDVFGRDAGSTPSEIEIVEFAVALTAGGTALDMNSSVLTFQKSDVAVTTLTHAYANDYVSSTSVLNETTDDNKWWIYQKVNGDDDISDRRQ